MPLRVGVALVDGDAAGGERGVHGHLHGFAYELVLESVVRVGAVLDGRVGEAVACTQPPSGEAVLPAELRGLIGSKRCRYHSSDRRPRGGWAHTDGEALEVDGHAGGCLIVLPDAMGHGGHVVACIGLPRDEDLVGGHLWVCIEKLLQEVQHVVRHACTRGVSVRAF